MSGFLNSNSKKKILLSLLVLFLVFRSQPVLAGGGVLGGGEMEELQGEDFLIERTNGEEAAAEERGLLGALAEEKESRWWAFGLAGLVGLAFGLYTLYRRRRRGF